jgi:hypothetical protein
MSTMRNSEVVSDIFNVESGIPDGHQHRVIIPEVVLIRLSSWEWTQSCSKHVEDSKKYVIEEIVRQIGYLPELYEATRSEKYKVKNMSTMRNSEVVSDIFNVESVFERHGLRNKTTTLGHKNTAWTMQLERKQAS